MFKKCNENNFLVIIEVSSSDAHVVSPQRGYALVPNPNVLLPPGRGGRLDRDRHVGDVPQPGPERVLGEGLEGDGRVDYRHERVRPQAHRVEPGDDPALQEADALALDVDEERVGRRLDAQGVVELDVLRQEEGSVEL